MAYRSNIQAARIGRGSTWKNLWIPNYKNLYTHFFVHDILIYKYIKTKFTADDRANKTFMYYYDYYIFKTFDKIFLFLKKYNVDFSRLNQAAFIGKLFALNEAYSKVYTTDFQNLTMRPENIANFSFQPQNYYFFYLLNQTYANQSLLGLVNVDDRNFKEEQFVLLQGLSSSLFLADKIFNTKTNFFPVDNFEQIAEFYYMFERLNISTFSKAFIPAKYVWTDHFRLANFLFNPTILQKYPNFVFLYNSWLHKSWQLSKRRLLQSFKLFDVEYTHSEGVEGGIDYFFTKYLRFFSAMKELNTHINSDPTVGIGITQEFIWKQIALLHLKLNIWELMIFRIKEVWFYLKSYLRYFSYEGKINLNWSKIIFKKLFSFRKLISQMTIGYQFSTYSLLGFLKFFYFGIVPSFYFDMFIHFFSNEFTNFNLWYTYFCKTFLHSLKILKFIIKKRVLSLFAKIKFIHFFSSFLLICLVKPIVTEFLKLEKEQITLAHQIPGESLELETFETEIPGESLELETFETEIPGESLELEIFETEIPGESLELETFETEIPGESLELETFETEIPGESLELETFETEILDLEFSVDCKFEIMSKQIKFHPLFMNLNSLVIFFLFFFKFNLLQETTSSFALEAKPTGFLITGANYTLKSNFWKTLVEFYDNYFDTRQCIKHSDWSCITAFDPNLLISFLKFSYIWRLFRKKNFFYFYFILSHLTPKLFFWIFTDLSNLTHFGLILHLCIIYWQNFFFFYLFVLKCLKKMYVHCGEKELLYLSRPIRMFMQKSWTYITVLDLFSSSFRSFLNLGLFSIEQSLRATAKKYAFTLGDFAVRLVGFGKPNCWAMTTENKRIYLNKFTYEENLSDSSFFMPFISINLSAAADYKKTGNVFFEKKNRLNIQYSHFWGRVVTHLIMEHFSNLNLNATLIAIFVKKKLERDHLLAEILRSLNTLVSQSDVVKGFLFLLKGRFSWKERAAKVWFKKGKLEQVATWTKIDYCKMPVTLKYGSASVWIWLLLLNKFNNLRAII